ncbi:MAG TPA: HlyD family type I secretion periplasmic adaptor subunit [Hyphomicrobiaceae bacterium]|nr:HlyD family type I secretion periplasmic adaptor subunit [Hyphomicrobiaceae bacterium]
MSFPKLFGITDARPADWHDTAPWVRIGNQVTFGLLGGLFLFSAVVTISGAVVASGVVTVENNYKVVQHLDGGIVAKIIAKNGDRVGEGDALVKLDDTQVRASHQVILIRLFDVVVQQARLEAERDRKSGYAVPDEITARAGETEIARILTTQKNLFEARKTAREGELSVLRQRAGQISEEAKSLEAQLAARLKEQAISMRELANLRPLFEKGFVNQGRIGPVEREAARLEGEVGRLRSEVAKSRGAISEIELKILQIEKDFTQTVVDELRKVQAQVAELSEQRTALEDKLKRTVIRAPRSGRVHALAIHTEGGVITPATAILQIIPDGERLIIEAQVPPTEIDKVRTGLKASIRFPASSFKTTPRLEATVMLVSAAQITDQQGRSYFTVQLELSAAELKKLPAGHGLIPGMPAEVYIETERRSILSYFVKPLTDALARTFKES